MTVLNKRLAIDPREDRARKAMSALANPDVRALIDVDKLVRSSDFADIADGAMRQLVSHGDVGFVQRVLALVAGTRHEAVLLEWFSARSGINLARSGDKLRIQSMEAAPDENASLSSAFPFAAAARRAGDAVKAAALAPKKRRVVVAKANQDLMNSRLMLPGSFGSAKRR
jgi:hypothetical protein